MSDHTSEILKQFSLLCTIPHGSGNEKHLSDIICEKLYEWGLSPTQDDLGNIVCDIAGAEGAPLVALQAHLDMVCAVGKPSYHPAQDPIRPIQQNGWICTSGESSLGADCGAGVAVMLWLASCNEFTHPPLRLLFTVQEEIGLIGANAIDPSCMEGVSYFINLDGFQHDLAVVGSAGGVRVSMTHPIETIPTPQEMTAWKISLSGLRGGHSGADIDKGHLNAIRQFGIALLELSHKQSVLLAELNCGTSSNTIPTDASAVFVTDRNPTGWIEQQNVALRMTCPEETTAHFSSAHCPLPARVYTQNLTNRILGLATMCYNGVYRCHHQFKNLVGDSANLGVLRTGKDQIIARAMLRHSTEGGDEKLIDRYTQIAAANDFTFHIDGRYPVWPGQPDSKLAVLAQECHQAVTGNPLRISVEHVGLEPAVFYAHGKDTQFITLGMTIENCHSPRERWELATIEPFAEQLLQLLTALANS